MTPNIFLSWSSPDIARVVPLVERLKSVGLKVFDYSEDMGAGDNIHQRILNAINEAQMAIICFTDETADRPWITKEADFAFKTLHDGNHKLEHIVPVWVGPHPENKVPEILRENNFNVVDISRGDEDSITRFVLQIFKTLGGAAPVVIPVALFAMTRQQCEALLAKKGMAQTLAKVCQTAGMKQPPPIRQALLPRYGATADELAPFNEGKPLREIIDRVLESANKARVSARPPKRPIWLRWMQDELFAPDPATAAAARTRWAACSSLLIVDSVSAYDDSIRERLMNLPEPKRPERAAILWLPPYTQHTAALESILGPTAGIVSRLGDAFNDWRDDGLPSRAMTFDTATPTATRRWLRDAFLDVDDETEPLPEKLSNMEKSAGRYRLDEMLRAAKGGGVP